MAKKQVFGLKSGRGLCPVCGEQITHVKFVKPHTEGTTTFKFREFVAKVCKCPEKTLASYMK